MVYFTQHFFSDRKKKPLDYSLWFLSNLMNDDLSKTLKKGYHAKALFKRSGMALVSAS